MRPRRVAKCLSILVTGRRMCMGEQLARVELFLVTSHLMQRFTIQFADEKYKSNIAEPNVDNVTNIPTAFEVFIESRI